MNKLHTSLFLLVIIFVACTSKSNITNEANESISLHWRLTSSFPKALKTFWEPLEQFCNRVEELSDNNFTITPYQPGELAPALEVLDVVQQGSIEMGYTASAYYTGKNIALAFDVGLPFGLSARQQNAWLYEGGGMSLLQEVYTKFNIKYFPFGNTGAQMGGWFRQEISSLKDLKGLRMRIPGIGGEVMSNLGVTVQNIAAGDIYTALEQGTIDATEFISPTDDASLGFYNVAPYYYYPGWWEPGTTISLYINLPSWENLPDKYKAIIEVAAKEANIGMLTKYDHHNGYVLNSLKDKGAILKSYPEEILSAAEVSSQNLFEEYAQSNGDFSKIYASWKEYKENSDSWFLTGELALKEYQSK